MQSLYTVATMDALQTDESKAKCVNILNEKLNCCYLHHSLEMNNIKKKHRILLCVSKILGMPLHVNLIPSLSSITIGVTFSQNPKQRPQK